MGNTMPPDQYNPRAAKLSVTKVLSVQDDEKKDKMKVRP